jgi:hypothetical protein
MLLDATDDAALDMLFLTLVFSVAADARACAEKPRIRFPASFSPATNGPTVALTRTDKFPMFVANAHPPFKREPSPPMLTHRHGVQPRRVNDARCDLSDVSIWLSAPRLRRPNDQGDTECL